MGLTASIISIFVLSINLEKLTFLKGGNTAFPLSDNVHLTFCNVPTPLLHKYSGMQLLLLSS